MRRFRSVLVVVVLGLAGALAVPGGVSAMPERTECRPTAFVSNAMNHTPENVIGTVSAIDVKTRTKDPSDITVGFTPHGVGFTPDGKTAFVANKDSDTVSIIDVKTRTKDPTDIHVGTHHPYSVLITPDGKTA